MRYKLVHNIVNSFSLLVILISILFISGCETQNLGVNVTCKEGSINCALSQASVVQPSQELKDYATAKPTQATDGLQIVIKDLGMPDVFYLQPTIKEIQLQNENKQWITIWSEPAGKAIKLTPDGAENVLDIVSVPVGTYIGTKLFVSTMEVGVDINRDGDIDDKNVEIILTLDEFNKLPHPERPSGPPGGGTPPSPPTRPDKPQRPDKPSAPDMTGAAVDDQQPPEQPSEPSEPNEPDMPQAPPEPSAPQEPQAPYRIEGDIVYTGQFMDEVHTDTINDYIDPQWENNFVYSGKGGKLVYDFTLHPLLPKGQHISINVYMRDTPIIVNNTENITNITVPKIILLDEFNSATIGQGFEALTYENSLPDMDKAINLAKGNYVKYSFPSWYKWDGAHSWDRNEAARGVLTEGSIGVWINPRQYTGISIGKNGPSGILTFNWGDTASYPQSGYISHLGFTADGKLTYSVWGGNLAYPLVGNSVIPLNKWTHVAVSWGPKGTNLYVNGKVDAATDKNMWPAFSDTTYVYLNYWGADDLGLVDNLRITNVAEHPIIIPPANITVNETKCVAEGSSNGLYPSAPQCCEGLTHISCDAPDAAGSCQDKCIGAFYCTKCSDGICGPGENKCNCPKDCLPIPPANTTENLTKCAGEGNSSYNVYPGSPSCCEEFTTISCDAPDSAGNCKGQCVGTFYCTHCGNGICGDGENKCNCPKDCLPIPPANITKNVTAGVNISSFTCVWTNTPQNCFRAVVKGTAQGPVGTRLELPILVWSDDTYDCGAWGHSTGALVTVGHTCRRRAGDPETMNWTVDTGGNECPAKYGFSSNRKYSVKTYKDNEIYPLAVDNRTVQCQ